MFQISIVIPNTIKNGIINSKTPVNIRATNPPPLLFLLVVSSKLISPPFSHPSTLILIKNIHLTEKKKHCDYWGYILVHGVRN